MSVAVAGGVATTTTVSPISYREIEAWARLTGRSPQPWEVELLRELDAVWLTAPKKESGDGDRRDGYA